MRIFLALLLCIFLGCNSQPTDRQEPVVGSKPAIANGKDPREELDTAIAEARRQLESKEYEKFVADFVSPAEKYKMSGLKIADIDDVLEPLADDLIGQLQGSQKMQPVLEDDGMLARFKNPSSDGRDLVFEKTGNLWYIQGATPAPAD